MPPLQPDPGKRYKSAGNSTKGIVISAVILMIMILMIMILILIMMIMIMLKMMMILLRCRKVGNKVTADGDLIAGFNLSCQPATMWTNADFVFCIL